MKDVIRNLQELQIKYPKRVTLYEGLSDEKLDLLESLLALELDAHYKELLRFSNGFSIIDYCFLGFNNSVLANLYQENYERIKIEGYQEFCFLATSGDEEFLLNIKNGKISHLEDGLYETKLISDSFIEFMIQFVGKAKILLNVIPDNDSVMYFDEIAGLESW